MSKNLLEQISKDDWSYLDHTPEENRQHLIEYDMALGYSREEAEASVNMLFSVMKKNEDAK